MSDKPSPAESAADARGHLLSGSSGTLSTIATAEGIEGFPFGSVVPYALTARCEPVLLMSTIAQHSRNLSADPRAAILVQDRECTGDPQTSWRITVIGEMRRLEKDDPAVPELHARYLERVPGAEQYFAMHDFHYWVMDVKRVRFIAGFARIRWVEPEHFLDLPGAAGVEEAAPGIVEHMNSDHADAVLDYCRGLRGLEVGGARITAVDSTGFLVETEGPEQLVYFPFGREIAAEDARTVFVDLVKQARAKLAG